MKTARSKRRAACSRGLLEQGTVYFENGAKPVEMLAGRYLSRFPGRDRWLIRVHLASKFLLRYSCFSAGFSKSRSQHLHQFTGRC